MRRWMSWERDARCRGHDPEVFFDARSRSERLAKSICASCPVRAPCLALALEQRIPFGVWGGLSPRERAALARAGRGAGLEGSPPPGHRALVAFPSG